MGADTLRRVDVASLEPAMWEALTQDRPLLSLELLQECAAARQGRLVILLQGDANCPDAALIGTICGAGGTDARLEKRLYGRFVQLAVTFRLLGRTLAIGSPVGEDSGVVLREHSRAAGLGALLDAVERWAEAGRLGLGFLAEPEDSEVAIALRGRWWASWSRSRTTTEMRVTWADFSGYLASLDERGSAGRMVRREQRRNLKAGVVIRAVPTEPENLRELQRLAELHYRLRNGDAEYLPPGMLERALPRMGERALILEAVRNGRRCAMMALIRSGSVGWPAWIGIEPEDRPNDFTYFNLAYYEIAGRAALLDLRKILYGNSVYDAKVRRGAVGVRRVFAVRPRGWWRRALTRATLAVHARFVAPKFR